ncbi:TMV resistance protein N [Vitis vinifera]|uniref:TMV resistance protein N n=1 Tax=Vitis vinifera TaxID=29760 RepID=A0A438FRN2_VITVI|nr:TMV resistance protein N [Vitis vinifera]
MASPSIQRSSSSFTSRSQWSYDVDDEELPRGEEIAPELLKAIEESRSAIIVFSKTYAHSKWCLEELVKIMKCKEEREQMNADEERKEKIRKWKTALRQASNLAGYDAKDRYETELIDKIIENVPRSFPKTLAVTENIVGMDYRLERLISLLEIGLNDVRMVGVYGLGGIGKTTIINALYNRISNQFESGQRRKIVLRNVHEGIKEIRDKLSSKRLEKRIAEVGKGGDVEAVSRILDGSGCEAESGINVLVDRCFITILEDNTIDMHDLLAQMGKGIVDEECPNEPGERSRLWRHTDIYRVLKRNTGTEKIEGIFFHMDTSEQIQFTCKAFKRMNRLRLLILSHNCIEQLPEDFVFPSDDLTCLGCVRLENLPGDIHKLKHLLTLHCSGCSKLTSFPKIKRSIGKLEKLSLDNTAIKELPSSIELLEGLRNLYLDNCKNLESLPNSICNLRFLEALSLDGCSKLDRLPEDLERMPCLRDQCNLTPGVIKSDNCLNALKELSLRNCNLNGGVFHCIFHLSSLEVLNLSRCNPEEGGTLSDMLVGISQLSNLRALDLSHCKKVSQIPELPSSLRLLDMHSSIGTSLPPMHSLVNCLKSASEMEILREGTSIGRPPYFKGDNYAHSKIFSVRFRPKAITIEEWNTADSIKLDEIVGSLQLEMTPIVPKRKKH